MAKIAILMSRRPDLSRPAFREYYETGHAKLAAEHLQLVKYLRNHVIDADGAPIDFDCLTELYLDTSVPQTPTDGEVGQMFAEDESRFCDRPLVRSATSVETILAGGPREVDAPGTRRVVLILESGTDITAAARRWAASFDRDRIRRITLDVTTPMRTAIHDPGHFFPFGAFMSLWPAGALPAIPAAPAGIRLVSTVTTEIYETSPQDLSGGQGRQPH